VVISGSATIIRNDEKYVLNSNQSIYIAAGDKHQLSNNTTEELLIVEVQTGTYFGEDDIFRYQDNTK
jgi:mannose-6-phosphate isomerase-like protein (cupin superfamily)